MGWMGHALENGYLLYTRGGLHGVYISHEEDVRLNIEIPDELLIMLAADTVRSNKIAIYEDMSDEDILK